MTQAKLNNELIATVAGDITVFNYDGETREYLSSSVEYLAVGVGIPTNSCIDAPLENKIGFAICRTTDLSSWEYITDNRGQIVYSTETMQQVKVTTLGGYPANTTLNAPASQYDKWDGDNWVEDTDAKHAAEIAEADTEKSHRLGIAQQKIVVWQTKLLMGRKLTDAESASLNAWMDYIDAVTAIDTSTAPDINWPVPPEV